MFEDRGIKEVLRAVPSYHVKKPPVQTSDEEALIRPEVIMEGRLDK